LPRSWAPAGPLTLDLFHPTLRRNRADRPHTETRNITELVWGRDDNRTPTAPVSRSGHVVPYGKRPHGTWAASVVRTGLRHTRATCCRSCCAPRWNGDRPLQLKRPTGQLLLDSLVVAGKNAETHPRNRHSPQGCWPFPWPPVILRGSGTRPVGPPEPALKIEGPATDEVIPVDCPTTFMRPDRRKQTRPSWAGRGSGAGAWCCSGTCPGTGRGRVSADPRRDPFELGRKPRTRQSCLRPAAAPHLCLGVHLGPAGGPKVVAGPLWPRPGEPFRAGRRARRIRFELLSKPTVPQGPLPVGVTARDRAGNTGGRNT